MSQLLNNQSVTEAPPFQNPWRLTITASESPPNKPLLFKKFCYSSTITNTPFLGGCLFLGASPSELWGRWFPHQGLNPPPLQQKQS